MKKICRWMLAFCLAFALGTLAASAADTVYVKDGGTGDGTSALSPLGDLADAIRAVSGGGKVVLVGDTSVAKSAGYDASVGAFTAPDAFVRGRRAPCLPGRRPLLLHRGYDF